MTDPCLTRGDNYEHTYCYFLLHLLMVLSAVSLSSACADGSNGMMGRMKPSIPSRFKPPRRRNTSEPKGFGSTNRRFQQINKGVPGPFSYPKMYVSEILRGSPSISKRGHFASKVPRLPDDPLRPNTPGKYFTRLSSTQLVG